MKEYRLLVWLTQLGLSTAIPLAGFTLLALWLHRSLGWGKWVLLCGIALGILSAVRGLMDSLKVMERMSEDRKQDEPPPVSFNSHD